MQPLLMKAKELRAAIQRGDLEQVDFLVGKDDELLRLMTPFGTWLHVASTAGFLPIVKYLVGKGVGVDERGGTFDAAPIKLAASNGHLDVVEYLFSVGSTLDVSEPERNPLFAAIYGGHIQIVQFLIAAGMDVHVKYSGASMQNMDALAFAKERGQKQIADILESV